MLGARDPWLQHARVAAGALAQTLEAAAHGSSEVRATLSALHSPHAAGHVAAAQVLVGAQVCAHALSQTQAIGHRTALEGLAEVMPDLDPLWGLPGVSASVEPLCAALASARVRVEDLASCFEAVLAEHDAAERRRLGVFHTPPEVARYMADSIDAALTDLGLRDGLCDTGSYEDYGLAPVGMVAATAPILRFVEPAVGVGVLLRELLRAVSRRIPEPERLAEWLTKSLAPRLCAYDVLPAALALCRLHLAAVLAELGCPLRLAAQFELRCENFLEEVAADSAALAGVTVLLGNPPYARSSQNRSPQVRAMLDDYKANLQGERNLQPLSDDYIKFVRATELLMGRVPLGVVSLVTNHTFVRGRLHRSMRRSLRATFATIDVLDLHGSTKVRVTQGRDENVFPIAQGVAVTTCTRDVRRTGATVRYRGLSGLRVSKLARLREASLPDAALVPTQPYDVFAPVEAVPTEYAGFVALPDLFAFHSVGGKPGDDRVLVGFEADELLTKVQQASDALGSGGEPRTEAARKLAARATDKPFARASVIPYAYRPFDERLAYYEPGIWTRPLQRLQRHVDGAPFLLTTRILKDSQFAHVFATRRFPDVIALSTTSSVNCYAFPLRQIRPEALERACGLRLSPEEAFAYVYATLHSPVYRARYLGALRYDFPRIPLGREPGLVAALVARGGRLLRAHLGEGDPLGRRPRFVDGGDRIVRSAGVEEAEGLVQVNVNAVSRFVDLPRECWEFRVGGYQVCRKWLVDRRRVGRALSDRDVAYYCDMVARIDETLLVQREVDAAVESFGGWPNAFVDDPAAR